MIRHRQTDSDRHPNYEPDSTQKAYKRNLYIMVFCALLISVSMLAGKQCQSEIPADADNDIERAINSRLSASILNISVDTDFDDGIELSTLDIKIISLIRPNAFHDQIAEIERIIYDVLRDKEVEIVIRFYESSNSSLKRKGIAFVSLHKTTISDLKKRFSRIDD